LGFMGIYTVLSILFIVLVYRIIAAGPAGVTAVPKAAPVTVA